MKNKNIENPLIFNSGAVRPELKEGLEGYTFITAVVRRQEGQDGQASGWQKDCAFASTGRLEDRLIEVINFRDELEKEDSPLSGMPTSSLTFVLGQEQDTGRLKKLCEITYGEIFPEVYKLLQNFMTDIILNWPELKELQTGSRDSELWAWIRS